MTEDQVVGMMVGCAVGDAFGAPFEFKRPENIFLADVTDDYATGGVHDVGYGEWTDDTAMMLATAKAYADHGGLSPEKIVRNFKTWRAGKGFGTRNYVFDIGGTTDTAIGEMSEEAPYAGQNKVYSSGNGSIMRIAPVIAANHQNPYRAVGEGVAVALMTHGNEETIRYISAFVSEMIDGYILPENASLRRLDIHSPHATGTIMHSYCVAVHVLRRHGDDFLSAMKEVVMLGHDTDTNCAVAGMVIGRSCGMRCIPTNLVEGLQQKNTIISLAKKLHEIGKNS